MSFNMMQLNSWHTEVLLCLYIANSSLSFLEFWVGHFQFGIAFWVIHVLPVQVTIKMKGSKNGSKNIEIYFRINIIVYFEYVKRSKSLSLYFVILPYSLTMGEHECPCYLLNNPRYEYANIFGANWLTTEWYPSRQLVWPWGEDLEIPLHSDFFVNAMVSFSCAIESVNLE